MNEVIKKQILDVLGWLPKESEKESVHNLNETSPDLVEAARRLPSLLRHPFIRHYVSNDNYDYVPVFIEDVIENKVNVKSWRKGRILVPDFGPGMLVQLQTEDIVKPLSPAENENWFQINPDRSHWNDREYLTGAPAILRPDLNYKYYPPVDVRDLLIPEVSLNPIVDLNIAVRRWIASNVAGVARRRNFLDVRQPADLLKRCFPDVKRLSSDAMLAASGLIREMVYLPEKEEEVPGFRGPDDWYKKLK